MSFYYEKIKLKDYIFDVIQFLIFNLTKFLGLNIVFILLWSKFNLEFNVIEDNSLNQSTFMIEKTLISSRSIINDSLIDYTINYNNWNLLFFWSISSILFLFLFKWAAWPTYNWAIFIYNISNTGAAGFLSFSMKFVYGIFILILNIYLFNYLDMFWSLLLLMISIFSSLFAVLGAVNERFIKKFLLYSSLGHVSFMLLGLVYFLNGGFEMLFLYLVIYTLMSNISWLFLVSSLQNIKLLNSFVTSLNNDTISKVIISLILFSLSGLPPFSGFFVKFEMLLLSIYSSDYLLVIILLILSLITLFYYIRIIKIIFFDKFELSKNLGVRENILQLLISFSFICVTFFILFFDYSMVYYLKNFINCFF